MEQCDQVHVERYLQTMRSIQEAEEIRQMEANLKFMAQPYKLHRRLRLQNNGNNHIITKRNQNFEKEANQKSDAWNSKAQNEEKYTKVLENCNTVFKKLNKTCNLPTKPNSSTLSFENEKEIDYTVKEVDNLEKLSKKEIRKIKNKRKKEAKMKRMMTKRQFKAEQRQVKMEIKMRKAIQKRIKLTKRKADKQRKRAEKMLRVQQKLEKFSKTIYIYIKKLFDVASLCIGLTLVTLGLFAANVPTVPMILIGAILVMVGIGGFSLRVIRHAQAARKRETYKASYLETVQSNIPKPQMHVII